MAKYVSNASINLSVNGAQARKMLDQLKKDASDLEKKIQRAAVAGDKASMKKWQKQLNETNKLMSQLTTETQSAAQVLARLDRATPKELNKTLATLRRELNNIERGSAAWDQQTAKIQRVQAEIQKVNASMAVTKTRSQSIADFINKWQVAIMGAAAAVTGFVMAGRKSVNAYAEMDEQTTNTVKYTGMSDENVEKLNDRFKHMDTRTTREKLNELAQEAGRLGKNTLKSVQGYVEAADIINVALVDLGEGATQTIAKLTNIFGVEQMLGTKDAMLSVGSTVNVLSQNCTASKPYLVEFAQRMAGIGSQAGLTIPQILAFGAVLDANGQKVEMSATAIQKVIMNLANKNREFAATVGLDAAKLNETLKHSAKDGLIMFLEALQKMGSDVGFENATMTLAPAFKDMGLDAARVSQVLSTLAMHLDEVKWQMGEADKAFREASSATHEYELFNNTAQASIDKSKKRVSELAIELGEKLYPIMKHIYTSSGIFLRLLNQIVTFVIKNRTAILSLTAAIIAYYVAVNIATVKTKAMTAATVAWKAVALSSKAVWLLLVSAVSLMTGGVTKARAAWRLLNVTMATNPIGMIVAAVVALGVALLSLIKHTETYTEKADKVAKKAMEVKDSTLKEQHELDVLIGTLKGAEKGSEQYLNAKQALLNQYGKYLSGLIDEKGEIINLSKAYDTLSLAIQRSAQLRGIGDAKSELEKQYFSEQSDSLTELQKRLEKFGASASTAAAIVAKVSMAMASGKAVDGKTYKLLDAYSKGGLFSGKSPMDLYSEMRSNYKDYTQAQQNLDNLELGINPSKNYQNSDLLRSREELMKIVEKNESGVAYVPNLYAPSDKKSMPYVLNEDGQKKWIAEQQSPQIIKAATPPEPTGITPFGGVKYSLPGGVVPGKISFDVKPVMKNPREDLYSGKGYSSVALSPLEAKKLLATIEDELRLRGQEFGKTPENGEGKHGNGNDFSGTPDVEAGNPKSRAELVKSDAKFQAWLKRIEEERDRELAQAIASRAGGFIDYQDYKKREYLANSKYYGKTAYAYKKYGIDDESDSDYKKIIDGKKNLDKQYNQERVVLSKEAFERAAAVEEQEIKALYATKKDTTLADEIQLQEELLHVRLSALKSVQALYEKHSKEWYQYENKIQVLLDKDKQEKQNMLAKATADFQKKFEKQSAAENLALQLATLKELYKQKYITEEQYQKWKAGLEAEAGKELPGGKRVSKAQQSADDAVAKFEQQKAELDRAKESGLIDEEEYSRRLKSITLEKTKALTHILSDCSDPWVSALANMAEAWENFAQVLNDSDGFPFDDLGKGIEATAAVMTAVMQQVTAFTEAQTKIQIAAIEKKYDREISLAEGNAYLTKKLEKQKEDEIARQKEEASKKSFAMQVIAAVAQTATNALNAYGSAAAIPVVGHILAPIAAATAVAAGAVQIATLKKQQQAAAATGYSEGGFTRPGRVDEPAGVVHAGEWVASQKLVNSPQARPLINMLEYAQRNNTMASLSMEDVSRSIAAPMMLAYSKPEQQAPVIIQQSTPDSSGATVAALNDSISRLNARLDEPFVTHNTVVGKMGIKQAQDKYQKIMSNKSRKKRS